jgi:Flp pilus assembly protein TadG
MTLRTNKNERGSTLVEFAIGATVFLTAMFAVLEFGRALWVHNALSDAARRGARYAVLHPESSEAAVKNVVVYGDPLGGTQPLVENLDPETNVNVTYSDFVLDSGTASVTITGYEFRLIIPIIGTKIQMPDYHTTLTGESVGLVPPPI